MNKSLNAGIISVLLRIVLLFILVSISGMLQAATITSTATGGTWSTATTWIGGVAPTSTDAVVIATTGAGAVTMGASTTCASITVNSGAKLVIGRRTLTVTSFVNNAGTITLTNGRITQNGTGDFTNSGTITYSASGRLYLTGSFTNTGTITFATTTVYFTGKNTAASTSSGLTTTGLVTYQRTAGSVTMTGNLKSAGLTVSATGGTLNLGVGLTHTFTAAVTISAGTLNAGSSTVYANLLGTAWSYNGGTFTAGTSTVVLGGAGAQTLAGTVTSTFNNLTLAGSGLKMLSRIPVVNGILSMEGTATASAAPTYGAASTIQYRGTASFTTSVEFPATFAGSGGLIIDQGSGNTVTLNETKTAMAGNLNIKSGKFDLSTFTINRVSAGGTLTIAQDAYLKIGGSNTLPSNYTTHSLNCLSTVEYAGTSQTVASLNSSQIYGNLILSGSGTKTLQTATTSICNNLTVTGTASVTAVVGLTVGGSVDIQAGSTVVAGAFTHHVAGNWTMNGTFVGTGSTVDFNGAGAATIGSSNFNNITLTGSGSKVATGNLTVSGALTISHNFSAGSFQHAVSGNWTNNGTFDAGTSTVTFAGSSSQSLNGSASSTFYNLTANGTGGVVLGLSTQVSGLLTLTSGIITLGVNNLNTNNVSGGSAASYVKTNSTGVLKRTVSATLESLFPVGNASYNPLYVTNTTTGNTDNYSVRVQDGALTNANDNTKTVNRKWLIVEDVAGGSALTLKAGYNAGEEGAGFNAATTPTIGYFEGASWDVPMTATYEGSGPYTFTSTSGALTSENLTSTSGFVALGSDNAFNASKFFIASINPATPFLNQDNVTIVVESYNSNNVLTDVSQNTTFSLSATNTTLFGTPTDSILANTNSATLENLMFTTTSTTATVTATQTSGDLLSPGTSFTFSVVVGNIYKPSVTGNWSTVQWQISTDGGVTYTNTTLPSNNSFESSDLVYIPIGIRLTADVTATFYNVEVMDTLDLTSGTLTLAHSGSGGDYGFQIFGTFRQFGGTFTNTNTAYPILIQGGKYIHAVDGGSIPVANWNSHDGIASTCIVDSLRNTAISSGLNQSFQNFTWNNTYQTVPQTLTSNLSVNGVLTLKNGIITTGPTYYVVVSASGSATSSNNARINGNFRKYIPNTSAPTAFFPIGDAANYTPVTVSFAGTTSGSGYVNASTLVAQPPKASALSQTKYINRNWTLAATGVGGFTSYSPTFTFVDGDKVGSPTTSVLVIRKKTNTIWSNTTTGTQGANSTQCTGVQTFGTFVIGEENCSSENMVWYGGTSTDWNTGSNWCNGTVPTSATSVFIPYGPSTQPTISSAAACKNVTVELGAVLTLSGSNTLSVYGNWSLSGTFVPGTGTIQFVGPTAQTLTGLTTFNNLTINNTAGASSASNQTVNGVLNLQSNNPSSSKGTLDMGSNSLYMGANGTTVGSGDVTGTILRTHSFAINTFYSFGNSYSGITFPAVTGQVMPTTLGVKVALGTAPVWTSGNSTGSSFPTTPLTRLYDVIQTGGSGNAAILRLHYLDNEISSGISESKLTLWHRIFQGGIYTVAEVGKSNQDITNNYISINDIDLVDIPSIWGYFQEAIAPTQAVILTWVGGTVGATTDWKTATNWEPAYVPSSEYGVYIPDAVSTDNISPILPAGLDTCISVVIGAGGILNTASGANLVLVGTDQIWGMEPGGVFNAGNSTITVNSIADYGTFTGSTNFYNVTVNDGAKLRLAGGSYTGIAGVLSLSSTGMLDAATTVNTLEYKGSTTQLVVNPNGSTPGYHNLIFSGSGTITLPTQLTLTGNLTNNGTLDASTNSSTVFMNGSTAQVLGGSTVSTFNNLTINNPLGVSAGNSFTVNGILNLESANPSDTIAALNMVTDWSDYPGTTNLNPGYNNMVSYYLYMGSSATTTGIGDVTGIVKRTTMTANTAYSFGNAYTTLSLTDVTGVNGLTVTIRIGKLPGHVHTTDAVKRFYEIVPLVTDPETFTSSATVSVNFHYLDSELNGNSESRLTTADYDIDGGATEPDEHGRAAYDFTNNYIGLSNVPISYFIKKTNHIWRTIFFMRDYKELQKIWNGSVSSNWNVESNWTPSGTPSQGSMVVIPNALTTLYDPILPTGSTTINTMTIENGGLLTMGNNQLVIFNSMSAGWEDQNTTGNDPGTSTVVFARSGATVSGSGRFYNVEIVDTSTVTLGPNSTMSIGNTFTRTGTGTGKFYADVYDGTVEYNKEGDQMILLPNTSTNHYHNLILKGSGSKTLPSSALSIHVNFSVEGTATTTATYPLTIGGGLTVGSGASFTAGSLSHSVGGNLLNNGGAFTATGSTFTLNGTTDQTIGGTVPLTFNNLTITNASDIITATSNISCTGNLVNPGILDMTSHVLAVTGTATNSGTIRTAVPTSTSTTPIPSGRTWGGAIEYSGYDGSQTAVAGTYANLSVTGGSGAVAASDITVNGQVYLNANPNTTTGSLHMGAYTLQMDLNGTFAGEGDLTGMVKRTGSFAANTLYTFGSQYTSITFTGVSSDRPGWISCKTVIGSSPSWRSSAVKRYYSFAIDKGIDRTVVKLRFLDSEMDAVETDKSKLVFWDAYSGPSFSNYYPRGKTGYNDTEDWVSLSGMAINFFVPSDQVDVKQWGLSYNNVSVITWTGNGSPTYAGDWSLPGNWNGGIPTATDAVLIPKLADLPVDNHGLPSWNSAAGVANTLEIASGSVVSLGSTNLTIYGGTNAWVNNGSFTSTGKVTFANEANTATLSGAGTNYFDTLSVADNAFLQLTGGCTVNVSGSITSGDGSILDFTTYSNTVDFDGASQSIINPVGFALNAGYTNLTLSGSGTKSLPSAALNVLGNLTLAGTASTSPQASLVVGGNLTIGSGTSFTAGNNTHYVAGGLLNNGGIFALSGSTFHLNGTSNQSIGGNTSTAFENLKINNAAGVTLGIDETVNGILDLSSGLVTTGNNKLIVACTGDIVNAGSSTYVDGKLARVYCSTGVKTFPIGKGGNYRPLTLHYTSLTGTSTVTAEQVEQSYPGSPPPNVSVFASRYWLLTQTGGSNFSYNITLDGTGWTPAGTPKMVVGNGTTSTAYEVTTPDYTNSEALTGFSYFGLGSYLPYITWLGSSSDNSWFTASNWSSASVPLSTDDIRIPSSLTYYPVISGTSPDNDVAIASTGKLQLSSGALLTLESGPVLTLESGATVTTESGSKLVLKSDARYLNLSSSQPTLEMQRQLTGTKGWRMVSSPVATTYSTMFASPLVTQGFTGATYPDLQPNLMWWDETDGGTSLECWRKPVQLTDSMSAGRGYFHYVFNGAGITGGGTYTDALPKTLSVTGIEQFDGAGQFGYNLTYTARQTSQTPSETDTTYYDVNELDQGWNLIANPTASTLNWDATAWTKINLDHSIYVWDPSALSGNGDYVYWNGTTGTMGNGRIPPFQAFWVHATSSPVLGFSNTAKTATTGTFLRSAKVDEPISIPLTLSTRQMHTTAYISFEDGGIIGPDNKDAYRLQSMSDTWMDLYTLSSSRYASPLVINNLPLRDTTLLNIPLFVDGQENGVGIQDAYTLTWQIPANWPKEWTISLQDHRNATAISMLDQSEYVFGNSTQSASNKVKKSIYSPERLIRQVSGRVKSTTETSPFSIVISRNGNEIQYMKPIPHLLPNYPNPFTYHTTIRFSLPESAKVRIMVYDLKGVCLETVTDGVYPAGITDIQWIPHNKVPGMYFVRFLCGDCVETGKIIQK